MSECGNTCVVHVAGEGNRTCRWDAKGAPPAAGDTVIVEIDGQLENGEIVADGQDADDLPPVTGVRLATEADLSRIEANRAAAKIDLGRITEKVRAAGIAFKPLDAHYSLNHERFAILCGCDEELDDRRILALIPVDIKSRVDIRQVWPRDQCARIGGIGPCGRAYCCCTWQKTFPSINIRMAKVQDIPLLPSSLNGGCERIKCCMRFEYQQYCDASEGLPFFGTEVEGAGVSGTVVGRDVLRGFLTVRTSEGRHQRIPVSELRMARYGSPPRGGTERGPQAGQREGERERAP